MHMCVSPYANLFRFIYEAVLKTFIPKADQIIKYEYLEVDPAFPS